MADAAGNPPVFYITEAFNVSLEHSQEERLFLERNGHFFARRRRALSVTLL